MPAHSKTNKGGYGRPPAKWLTSSLIADYEALSLEELAEITKAPLSGVRRVCLKYKTFLGYEYSINKNSPVVTIKVKPTKLRKLYDVLDADFRLRINLRHAKDGHPHASYKQFIELLKASRRAGLKGRFKEKLPYKIDEIAVERYNIMFALGLTAPNLK